MYGGTGGATGGPRTNHLAHGPDLVGQFADSIHGRLHDHATFFHTWANDEQANDCGELALASLGVEEDTRFADALCKAEGLDPIPNVAPGVSLAPGLIDLDDLRAKVSAETGALDRDAAHRAESG